METVSFLMHKNGLNCSMLEEEVLIILIRESSTKAVEINQGSGKA
jgi:hypothetical protein